MKYFFFVSLTSFLPFFMMNELIAQAPPPAKMSSTTTPSSTLEGTSKPLESLKPQQPAARQPLPPPAQRPPLLRQQAEYLHPGILVFLNGRWEGSDHLLNLSNNVGVIVSLLKPESETLDVSETQIQKEVESIFSLANIKPQTLVASGQPPLPTFEIEVFVYPIERGYVAFCEGRLFESVTLDRFKMDPNMAFQAITWEKQQLIVSPKAQFAEQLTKTVQDIATAFAERFQAYERYKKGGI